MTDEQPRCDHDWTKDHESDFCRDCANKIDDPDSRGIPYAWPKRRPEPWLNREVGERHQIRRPSGGDSSVWRTEWQKPSSRPAVSAAIIRPCIGSYLVGQDEAGAVMVARESGELAAARSRRSVAARGSLRPKASCAASRGRCLMTTDRGWLKRALTDASRQAHALDALRSGRDLLGAIDAYRAGLTEIIRVIDHEQPLGNGNRIREIADAALRGAMCSAPTSQPPAPDAAAHPPTSSQTPDTRPRG